MARSDVGLGVLGDRAYEGLVDVGQVAQDGALGAGQVVEADVVTEVHGPLPQVPGDGLE